jgi:hypothetical protein
MKIEQLLDSFTTLNYKESDKRITFLLDGDLIVSVPISFPKKGNRSDFKTPSGKPNLLFKVSKDMLERLYTTTSKEYYSMHSTDAVIFSNGYLIGTDSIMASVFKINENKGYFHLSSRFQSFLGLLSDPITVFSQEYNDKICHGITDGKVIIISTEIFSGTQIPSINLLLPPTKDSLEGFYLKAKHQKFLKKKNPNDIIGVFSDSIKNCEGESIAIYKSPQKFSEPKLFGLMMITKGGMFSDNEEIQKQIQDPCFVLSSKILKKLTNNSNCLVSFCNENTDRIMVEFLP